jgi:hypothetical protein
MTPEPENQKKVIVIGFSEEQSGLSGSLQIPPGEHLVIRKGATEKDIREQLGADRVRVKGGEQIKPGIFYVDHIFKDGTSVLDPEPSDFENTLLKAGNLHSR